MELRTPPVQGHSPDGGRLTGEVLEMCRRRNINPDLVDKVNWIGDDEVEIQYRAYLGLADDYLTMYDRFRRDGE